MIKSLLLIFLVAVSAEAWAADGSPTSSGSAASPAAKYPAAQPVTQDKTLRLFGSKTTKSFVETCKGRCRCAAYLVTETVAQPGIIRASKAFDVGPNRTPRCPGIGGTHNRQPVPGAAGKCYVCPPGMAYSTLLRGGKALLQRWGFDDPVCAKVVRKCRK